MDVPDQRGRRPRAFDEPPIPPAHAAARPLWGRALRGACRALLRAHGPLSLRALHTWLHHYGYLVDSATPVKALAFGKAPVFSQTRYTFP